MSLRRFRTELPRQLLIWFLILQSDAAEVQFLNVLGAVEAKSVVSNIHIVKGKHTPQGNVESIPWGAQQFALMPDVIRERFAKLLKEAVLVSFEGYSQKLEDTAMITPNYLDFFGEVIVEDRAKNGKYKISFGVLDSVVITPWKESKVVQSKKYIWLGSEVILRDFFTFWKKYDEMQLKKEIGLAK